jgi:putative tricarboxylic transport membrane protein
MKLFGKALCAIAFSLALASSASAAELKYPAYPHKTVTLITSSNPGGGGDVFLRQIVKVLGPKWGINFVVESVAGSGGANAMRAIVEGPKDGTLFYGVSTQHILVSLLSAPHYKYTDLKPVANLIYDAPIMFVLKDSPIKSVADLQARMKAEPGRVKYGVGTAAASDRVVAETFKKQSGLDFVIATHDSGGANLMSLLGGAVDVATGDVAEVRQHIDSGAVRPIASLTPKRLSEFPNLPTAREQGADMILDRFRGIVGHKELPADIVAAWEKAIENLMQEPEYIETMKQNSMIPAYLNSKDFDRVTNQLAADHDKFFKDVGLKK